VLLLTGMLSFVLWPLIHAAMSLIASAFNVPLSELFRLAQLR